MSRGLKITSVIFVILFLLGIVGTTIESADEARLADLKESVPQQYLDELRERDQELWLSELAELDPDQHVVESARIEETARVEAEEQRATLRQVECGSKNETMAYVQSQGFMKRRLRSPSTADFPWNSTSTTILGDCRYRVSAHVDSENGFGAMVRSNYSMVLLHDPETDMWFELDVNISQ